MWEFPSPKSDRLDRLLRNSGLEGSEYLSRQAWDWLLEQGMVSVNGRRCSKAGQEVAGGTLIQVRLPGPLGLRAASEVASLIWSCPSRRYGLFNKPCGVSTLPIFPWDQSTFASQVAAYLSQHGWLSELQFAALAAPPALEGGVLQRLDKDTSGIVCVAFTSEAKSLFRQLFSRSAFSKTYLAIVDRPIEGDHNVWLSATGAPKVRAMLSAPKGDSEESRLSIEIYKSSTKGAVVKVRTRGGARHVVRAGLAALGSPLLGDVLYGGSTAVPHHQLHASTLELLETGALSDFPQGVIAPPPKSFLDSAASLGIEFQG